ncbi:MAG: hypothetical protein ACJA0H_002185, partial [Francisellaceae bacterium]
MYGHIGSKMKSIMPILSPLKTITDVIEICFRGKGKRKKLCKRIL